MIDQIKIGQFIAAQRKSQGYTQAALAEKLGITDRAVSKWETGKSITGFTAAITAVIMKGEDRL